MNYIGIDYGIGVDIPTYVVIKHDSNKMIVVDTGSLQEFDYSRYVASEHQIIGSSEDLEKFKSLLKFKYKITD